MIKTTEFELLKATIQSYALLRIEFTTSANKFKPHAKLIRILIGTNCLDLKKIYIYSVNSRTLGASLHLILTSKALLATLFGKS